MSRIRSGGIHVESARQGEFVSQGGFSGLTFSPISVAIGFWGCSRYPREAPAELSRPSSHHEADAHAVSQRNHPSPALSACPALQGSSMCVPPRSIVSIRSCCRLRSTGICETLRVGCRTTPANALLSIARTAAPTAEGLRRGYATKGSMPKPWRGASPLGAVRASLSFVPTRCRRVTNAAARSG